MIRGTNLSSDIGIRLQEAELVFVEPALASQFSRAVATCGDLVFTCWGTVGQVGLLDGRCRFDGYLVSNKQMKMTPDPDKVSSVFLYYYLSQPRMQSLIRSQAIGSSVPGFNLGQLKGLPVDLPPLTVQTAIAEVLGALDDKIAANTGLASTAAELASLLYAQVRAAAREAVPFNDCVTTQYGIMTSATQGDGPRLLRVTDINKKPWIEWPKAPACSITDAEFKKYGVSCGDILVARMADPGKSAYIDENDPDAVFASYLVRLKTVDPALSLYVYYFLRSSEYQAYAEGATTGSVQRNMNARVIVDTEITLPAEQALIYFNEGVTALRACITSHLRENERLTSTRDALLPLLMSGKIRVKDAEGVVEGVV